MTYELENPKKQKPIGKMEMIVIYPSPEGSKPSFWGDFYDIFKKQKTSFPHTAFQCTGKDGTLPDVSCEIKPGPKLGKEAQGDPRPKPVTHRDARNLHCVEAEGIPQPKRVKTISIPGMQVRFNLRKPSSLGHMIWCSGPCFKCVFNWTSTVTCRLTGSGVCLRPPRSQPVQG